MSWDLEARLDETFDGDVPDSVDEAALDRLKAVAYVMDESVRVPGTEVRIGLDPLVSAVPVVGDVISGGLSLYIVVESAYLGVSYATLARMLANIAIDVGGGAIPFVGTVFDAFWKSNKRNVELLLDELGETDQPDAVTETSEPEPVMIEVDEPAD
ncbi:DUF4112 domain-containing protein [Halorientalis regularis]|jgi:hypothetical protein|uniref:DUF4112 domain-containing protein n=1 Tax=Halorientalis regularis TaxID=660518 RepID=A0A1G7J1H5_9EURY|nr:DUF4112 domain-containing protein [Halorientalis regularis]SDF18760.1 protein of unknown function [Halorientalis regularis]